MRDIRRLADDVRVFATQADANFVYWAERAKGRDVGGVSSADGAQLRAAPLNCGDMLDNTLFAHYRSVVMTSATLATPGAGPDGLDYLRDQLGCPDAEGLVLGSPFDFTKQVRGLRANVRDPRDWQGWEDDLVVLLERVARENNGRMLVLFTAYGAMRRVAERIDRAVFDLGYPLLVQGAGLSPAEMVARFKAEPSVMLGTDSFWQGIDVPGDALSTLVITRLPFAVPDHPLLEARHQHCEERGGNAFFDLSVPQAILKFKQGFGRLIRRGSDTGLFVVADPRVWNMRYGERFLAAIPDFPWERE
jgi:ATP-dependent DNA helicase DinG